MPHKSAQAGDAEYCRLIAKVAGDLRRREGWTKAHAAHALGITYSSYKRLEQGDYMPSGAELRRMAVTYQVDANLLLHGIALTGENFTPIEQASANLRAVFNRFVVLDRQQRAAVAQLVGDLYELAHAEGRTSEQQTAAQLRARLDLIFSHLAESEKGDS
ncbi:helix-turn-helix domain-containing protein [Microbulbifer sp. PSTR4-B]|uniref:helix-turn-helix domain-containing protein n=1 Tax=unclassified Microbulbifer TaxID=2619833 RepID=UPI00403AED52